MLFPTVTFAAFFVAVHGIHVALVHRATRWKVAMLGASYVFYGWWAWRLCGLIALTTVVNWLAARVGRRLSGRARLAVTAAAIGFDLGVLGLFKYYGFFVDQLGSVLDVGGLPVTELAVPVGISFYTFQAISYVVDVHRESLRPRPLLDVAVFLAFFPQLVAGPIVRATEFLPQLDLVGRPDRPPVPVAEAGWLIARGLFKKLVVASYLAEVAVDPVFAAPGAATRVELVVALYGYAVQIYADFSGYTDIAIGIALLLGFRFPANFDRPYGARSIQEFWRRWHLTLSRWLRDHLYIPLGGSRGSRLVTHRNLLLTMVLGGLWHGAAWTFVLWGALHGVALMVERAWPSSGPGWAAGRLVGAGRWTDAGRWLVTFHLVALAWVPFRAETIGLAGRFLTGLLTAPLGSLPAATVLVVIAGAIGSQLLPAGTGTAIRTGLARLDPALQAGLAGAALALVVALGPEGVAPFIYFQF